MFALNLQVNGNYETYNWIKTFRPIILLLVTTETVTFIQVSYIL